jgi:hypothetical protein
MATTIRSSALDFNAIKNNLKTYLAAQEEFRDYNFEASGLSNILDVLAYNTHLNGLIANFALNESYLGTAQLRSSIVSLAEGIGYIPDTVTASRATVRISFNTSVVNRDTVIALPAYTRFNSTVDDVTYTFQTIETYFATDDGTGFYEFVSSTGSNQISIFEGRAKTKTFYVGEYADNPTYIIPDRTIDADTAVVRVYPTSSSTAFNVYTNIADATSINANSTIYILKEAPNGFYELSFGDGETFGIAPQAGNKIEVQYLSTNGSAANGATIFAPANQLVSGNVTATLNATTLASSVGGDDKESIESIRKNAPFQYAAQNRMVTAADYSSLILRNYSTLIHDIKAWGGEDNVDPEFGAVYVSILFEDDVPELVRSNTKLEIVDLAEQLAVISFRLRFTDPVVTFIEVENFFQFNPRLTTLTLNSVQANVLETIVQYFENNTGGFEQSFRRSNMLSLVDDADSSILSSRANIRMQQRFTPTTPTLTSYIQSVTNNSIPVNDLNTAINLVNQTAYQEAANLIASYATSSYTTILNAITQLSVNNRIVLSFPASISAPDDQNFIVTSNSFTLNNRVCQIRNRLNSNILQVVATGDNTVIVDNLGSYSPENGTVSINYFTPTSIAGGLTFIKLSVLPANQSAISPVRNNILELDRSASTARAVTVTATN